MKQTVKTSRTAGYLEKIFRALNERYFAGDLIEPIITISPKKGTYGHCSVSKIWSKATGETVREINIASGTLDRPIENIVATMLHEMVHLYHLQVGVKDVSRGGYYHNKKFKEACEMRDLHIDFDPQIGWSITSPTEALIEFVIEQGWNDIAMNRYDPSLPTMIHIGGEPFKLGNDGSISKAKTSWRWKCPCCGMLARTTKDVTGKLKCAECDEIMVE